MNKAYLEVEFDSFGQVVNYLSLFNYGYYFRGTNNYSFELKSKLQRVFETNSIESNLWHAKEVFAINYFKRNYKAISNHYPKDDDIFNWLCLMQHYGAPTRLIDWTLSPFVALFFAYCDINNSHDKAIWTINPEAIKPGILQRNEEFHDDLININRFILPEDGGSNRETFEEETVVLKRVNKLIKTAMNIEVFGQLPIRGFYSDQRIISQQGCFLVQLNLKKSLDDIRSYSPNNPADGMQELAISFFSQFQNIDNILKDPNYSTFLKIRLKQEWKREVLILLEKMNITASTLFSTLEGIGRSTENYLILKSISQANLNFVNNSNHVNEMIKNMDEKAKP